MIREEVEEHSRAFWQKKLHESGRVGGRGTFGAHSHGRHWKARGQAVMSTLCPVKGLEYHTGSDRGP